MTKILVVDDSISVRKALERVLVPRAMEVTIAASGEQALEQLKTSVPDLVIADVVMPGMSGFELCSSVKQDADLRHVPVILISGIVDAKVISQAEQVGAVSVVSKPFTPDDLFPKIDAALSNLTASVPASAPTIELPPPTPPLQKPISMPQVESNLLDGLLAPFLEKPEVETVALVGRNGTLITAQGRALHDPALFATFCRTLGSIAGVFGEHLGAGMMQGMNFEYQHQHVLLSPVNDQVMLVVSLQGGPTVVKYLLQKQVPQLKLVLEAN
jgi:CheY-like chemotaxis protein